MTENPTPSRLCIKNPHLGRLVGAGWDMAISLLTLMGLPLAAVMMAVGIITCSVWFFPVAAALLAVAAFSVIFGVVWSFRGCLEPDS